MCGRSPRKYVPVIPDERYVGALVFNTNAPTGRAQHLAACYGAGFINEVNEQIRKGEQRAGIRT